jgi:hypothetical protein
LRFASSIDHWRFSLLETTQVSSMNRLNWTSKELFLLSVQTLYYLSIQNPRQAFKLYAAVALIIYRQVVCKKAAEATNGIAAKYYNNKHQCRNTNY